MNCTIKNHANKQVVNKIFKSKKECKQEIVKLIRKAKDIKAAIRLYNELWVGETPEWILRTQKQDLKFLDKFLTH